MNDEFFGGSFFNYFVLWLWGFVVVICFVFCEVFCLGIVFDLWILKVCVVIMCWRECFVGIEFSVIWLLVGFGWLVFDYLNVNDCLVSSLCGSWI